MSSHLLHDAILERIEVDWPERNATFRFRIVDGGVSRLEISGLRSVNLPRDEPWGPSDSVNEVRESAHSIEIEMQSGDVIVIAADAFSALSDAR